MISKKITSSILTLTTAATLAAPVTVSTVFAEDSATVNTNITTTANTTSITSSSSVELRRRGQGQSTTTLETRAKTRADQEIDRRITALNKLLSRIQDMKKVSASEKTTLTTSISGQITTLTNLKAKIDADTDAATLKTDVKSITDSYRIFALVLPQAEILAAADRLGTLVDSMTTVSTKLQARITTDQAAGKDVSAMQSALADFNAKVADAKTQAQTAINVVSGLTPDNGDQTKFQANQAALKQARADIKVGTQDLVTARKDANIIIGGIKKDEEGEKGDRRNGTTTASTTIHAGSND